MVFLGLDFIVSSLIWLFVILLFVFLFRKHIKEFFYKDISFDIFFKELKQHLEQKYPELRFDFSIIETSKSELNPNARKYLILDDIINQYVAIKLDPSKYPKTSPQSLQWGSYIFNSEPHRGKLPPDWAQRKNALLIRDNKKCFRCSTLINLNDIQIHMIKSVENGGKYFFENLIPLCKDCDKILNNKIKHLDIKEDLYSLVKGNV